jgi:hypothetical protein
VAAALREEAARAAAPPTEYTAVPNLVLDVLAPQLAEAELRVLLYLIRRIHGFHQQEDAVSLNQLCSGVTARGGERLDHGTGLCRKAVLHALDDLERRGLIARMRSRHGAYGRGTNVYRLTLDGHGGSR